MSLPLADLLPAGATPTFSGHETFALRGNWLKKSHDILRTTPDLFYRQDAFVLLGVGKNMAQSIRFWGRVCGIFAKSGDSRGHVISSLGHHLFDDRGWDPFLVTPTARWLLHWRIAARPETTFTWFYVFNMLRGGDFAIPDLAKEITDFVDRQGMRPPSETTLRRDIECLVSCYCPPEAGSAALSEDALACPLLSLGLIQMLPGQQRYRLSIGTRLDLPLEIVAFAIREQMQRLNRKTIAFSDLAYAHGSPGRVFRLDEDTLLSYVTRIHEVTNNAAYYSDQAGIRHVAWPTIDDPEIAHHLLTQAFDSEARYVSY
ncbi:DUF4007 family protein [Herpetosiphon llansteffanensis]|uniref:DUF4007 family protein n=1 Tax=Herpetosiphon llansteffanensis TaxID=2094568 RepID=UPI0013DF55A6|nr:DUF4007 family protein [Herpetosiphon llansteffanensis]